ncbi:MAG: hypothetical protein GX620_04710 [Chloroflexi bacterium]|nr:hypothetical protein [Chloroflexota bacterium]
MRTPNRLVTAIDRLQRRVLRIREFSDDPQCMLRLSLVKASAHVDLAGGTIVERGDRIGALHIWNEQMPKIPPAGPDLAWAARVVRAVKRSFQQLARHVAHHPDLEDIRAFRASFPLPYTPTTIQLLERLGLEQCDSPGGDSPFARARAWLSHRWILSLRRAFNPASARGLRADEITTRVWWISRQRLFELYGQEE